MQRPDAEPTPPRMDRAAVPVRVRYAECDGMRVAHHSVYAVWYEHARTELLRQQGVVYRDLEDQGVFFVVARMSTRFRRPARYDDELTIIVQALPVRGAKAEHTYEVRRGGEEGELLATGRSTLACVDGKGTLRPVPEKLMSDTDPT